MKSALIRNRHRSESPRLASISSLSNPPGGIRRLCQTSTKPFRFNAPKWETSSSFSHSSAWLYEIKILQAFIDNPFEPTIGRAVSLDQTQHAGSIRERGT